LVGLNDVALSGREIAMAASIDVHDWAGANIAPTKAEIMQSMRVIVKFLFVMIILHVGGKFLPGSARVLKAACYAMKVHNLAHD
jgi:hypothetical protein